MLPTEFRFRFIRIVARRLKITADVGMTIVLNRPAFLAAPQASVAVATPPAALVLNVQRRSAAIERRCHNVSVTREGTSALTDGM